MARRVWGPVGSGSSRGAGDGSGHCSDQSLVIDTTAPHKRDDSTFPVGRRASRRRSSRWAAGCRDSAVTVLVLSGELQLPFRGSLAGGVSRIKLTVPSIFPGELQLPLLRGSAGCFGCTGGCRESKATPKAPPFAMFTMAPLSTPPSRLHGLCPVRMRAPAFCLLFTGRTGCPLKVVSVQLPRILTVRLDSPPNPRHAEPSHLYLSTA